MKYLISFSKPQESAGQDIVVQGTTPVPFSQSLSSQVAAVNDNYGTNYSFEIKSLFNQ